MKNPRHRQFAQRHDGRRRTLRKFCFCARGIQRIEFLVGNNTCNVLANDRVMQSASLPRQRDQLLFSAACRARHAAARSARAFAHHAALVRQRGLQYAPTAVEGAEEIVGGEARVGDEHLIEVGFVSDLAQWPNFHAGLLHRQKEETDPGVLRHIPVGAGDQHAVIRRHRARSPHFRSIHHELIAYALGAGANTGEVGTRTRFAIKQTHRDFVFQ